MYWILIRALGHYHCHYIGHYQGENQNKLWAIDHRIQTMSFSPCHPEPHDPFDFKSQQLEATWGSDSLCDTARAKLHSISEFVNFRFAVRRT